MEESILVSIKKLLGITDEYTAFDDDILLHINSVLIILRQIGMEFPGETICDRSTTWDMLTDGHYDLSIVRSYVYFKVKKMFDPPTSGSVSQSLDNMISELEWRISVSVDPEREEV